MNPFSLILLWLFILNLGIALGAGLYESRIMLPIWAQTPTDTWVRTGTEFWIYVTTIPLTLLTLANLIAAWRDGHTRRRWWLTAVFVVIIERAATFGYFIPVMISLQAAPDTEVTVTAATLYRWSVLNSGRHVLILIGLLAALRTLSLSGERGASRKFLFKS